MADSPDIVALQVTVEGSQVPLLVTRDDFVARLKAAYLDPLHVLQVPGALMFRSEVNLIGRDVTYLKETDSWLATVTLPLSETAMGAEATLLARIDLRRLRNTWRNIGSTRRVPSPSSTASHAGSSTRSSPTYGVTRWGARLWACLPRARGW